MLTHALLTVRHLKNARISKLQYMHTLKMSSSPSPLSTLSKTSSSSSTQYVFVGGKGGVGKTTTSSALALALSDSGLRTLIVSTDPAHSLGDSLDLSLSSGSIVKVPTEMNLWALEVDVESALDSFKETAKEFNSESLSKSFGVPKDILDTLGLDDMASIFTDPPPGIDEIVALLRIFQFGEEKNSFGEPRFQRIVIDTAPTGHTLRLLQLPNFLNSMTGKLIKFRTKINGAVDSFKSLFGGGRSANTETPPTNSNPLDKLEKIQMNLLKMQSDLKDSEKTQFIVVTIPTLLALEESKRLLTSLVSEKIKVSSIVCNQIISNEMSQKYLATRSAGQKSIINTLVNSAKSAWPSIEVSEVPYIDTEATGLYGLKFFASVAHRPRPRSASNPIDSRKLTIFGGKGGVGKTTSSSSWAIQLCEAGFRTLVVSTDPAHSLGDALQERLSGVPKQLDTSFFSLGSGGELWAMEIDPQAALEEFRDIVSESTDSSSTSASASEGDMGGMMGALGLPNLKADLADVLAGIKEPPPGTDEIVALTKIVSYLKNGYTLPNGQVVKFDRIVIDTAPTGHTLRMLKLPPFLLQLTAKLKKVRSKMGGGLFGGGGGSGSKSKANNEYDFLDQDGDSDSYNTKTSSSGDKLEKFENNMRDLQNLLHDSKQCEFTVVTIPTALASAESGRLLIALKDENILVRRILVNQVLPSSSTASTATTTTTTQSTSSSLSVVDADADAAKTAADAFLNNLRQGQGKCLSSLDQLSVSNNVPVIKVPYFDMEIRTVYGLRVISNFLLPKQM